jgi:hypothetical protein
VTGKETVTMKIKIIVLILINILFAFAQENVASRHIITKTDKRFNLFKDDSVNPYIAIPDNRICFDPRNGLPFSNWQGIVIIKDRAMIKPINLRIANVENSHDPSYFQIYDNTKTPEKRKDIFYFANLHAKPESLVSVYADTSRFGDRDSLQLFLKEGNNVFSFSKKSLNSSINELNIGKYSQIEKIDRNDSLHSVLWAGDLNHDGILDMYTLYRDGCCTVLRELWISSKTTGFFSKRVSCMVQEECN